MAIKINGKAEPELEENLLKRVELNRQQRPDVFKRFEKKNPNYLNFLLNYFKAGK